MPADHPHETLRFIRAFSAEHRRRPRLVDIAAFFGINESAASHRLRALKRAGYVEFPKWRPREMQVVNEKVAV